MKKHIFFYTLLFVSAYKLSAQSPLQIGVRDSIYSVVLGENRTLNIYLPPAYANAGDSVKFPVIYLLDGSFDEDFIHVSGLVQFCNFPWVNTLPQSIVVGISNVDRRRDFTFPTTVEADKKAFPTTGGSAKFMSFLESELLPFIEKHYKCNASRMLVGQSLGGLFATEILYKKPQLFTQYLIISPSLWWDHESLLAAKPANTAIAAEVFIAVGKEGRVMERDSRKLYRFISKHYKQVKAGFKFLKKTNHANIGHLAVMNGFEFFHGLKQPVH